MLAAGAGSGAADGGLGAAVAGSSIISGFNLSVGTPDGETGAVGAVRPEAGIGGGAPPPRPATGAVAAAALAGAAVGGDLAGPGGGWEVEGGAPADPPKSRDNPDGAGPEVEGGESAASQSRESGGPLPGAGEGGDGVNDRSMANPSGGVLLETLSPPGIHPGRAQALDWGRSSGRGTPSRDTGRSPGRGPASRDTGRSPERGAMSRDTGRSPERGVPSRDTGRLSVERLMGGLTLKTVRQ